MRERLVTLLLALAAFAAFYGLWLRPAPDFDSSFGGGRPTTAERRGNGYAAVYAWLQRNDVRTRSLRERYTDLRELEIPSRGNLLVLTLPAIEVFRTEEMSALDAWVRRGNTLLIAASLIDQPGWSMGRAAGAAVQVESLTGIEFENAEARKSRLDDKPLAQRVREADELEARREAGEEDEEEAKADDEGADIAETFKQPDNILLTPSGPHALMREVKQLELTTDYAGDEWTLRIPYDSFVLTLARLGDGEGALFEQRLGEGSILLSSGGSLFTNRALGLADNARLFANIVQWRVASDGVVLFDDLRQGLSANYDPARFYKDPRLYKTLGILVGLWLVWVLGSTRLRAPAFARHDPSEAELVRRAGGLIARTVRPHHTARRLFDHFFDGVARAARGATGAMHPERGDLWQWLERHAAILPQELDQLKTWYADAHAERKLPLVPLQNLLDNLGKRL
jgi:Domain of unknown function (DUF4350)